MKCQICKQEEAEWAWMPFGPNETPDSYTLLGSHYRGFPVIKACSSCKQAFQTGDFKVEFEYKGHHFIGENHHIREVGASLWLGEKYTPSELNDAPVYTLMRDTYKGIEVAALVYEDNADLVQAFLVAPRLLEASEELLKLRDKIEHDLDVSSVDKADRDAILMALARIHTALNAAKET